MTLDDAAKPLSEPQRKEIFLALVDAQDHDMPVAQSRKAIAERFRISESQSRLIERRNPYPRIASESKNLKKM